MRLKIGTSARDLGMAAPPFLPRLFAGKAGTPAPCQRPQRLAALVMAAWFCASAAGAQVAITNLIVQPAAVTLGWTASTDLCLVAVSTSLCSSSFAYVGDVLATNGTCLTNTGVSGFFRVCRVTVVDIPDTNLASAIVAALPVVHRPFGCLYDVDMAAITNLDASSAGVGDESGLEDLTNLAQLNIDGNELTSLDLSLAALQNLACDGNWLGDLELDGCQHLQVLSCDNNFLPVLDLSSCVALEDLSCRINDLPDLELSTCAALRHLDCAYNLLSNLDLAACASLETLHCEFNQLTNLDVSACTNLLSIGCDDNARLGRLEVGAGACTNLSCAGGALTNLDLHQCPALVSLDCRDNTLAGLNISGCENLQLVHVEGNALPTLDLSDCVNLQEVHADGNAIVNVIWPASVSQLTVISLLGNPVGDLTPLIALASTGALVGSQVYLSGKTIDAGQVAALESYSVIVTVLPNWP